MGVKGNIVKKEKSVLSFQFNGTDADNTLRANEASIGVNKQIVPVLWTANENYEKGDIVFSAVSDSLKLFKAVNNVSGEAPPEADTDNWKDYTLQFFCNLAQKAIMDKEGNVISNTYIKKAVGKDLSSNDFTDELKQNLEENTAARHAHDNKITLDKITDEILNSGICHIQCTSEEEVAKLVDRTHRVYHVALTVTETFQTIKSSFYIFNDFNMSVWSNISYNPPTAGIETHTQIMLSKDGLFKRTVTITVTAHPTYSFTEWESLNADLQRQTEENKTAIENFKSEATTTYETKEDASAKLNESKSSLERLQYYGNKDIEITPESYFTVNDTGETITGLTDTGKTQTELVIPYKINGTMVTSIGDWAFESCTSLTSVTIGNSVTSIANSAFMNCTSLTSITILGSVTFIDVTTFMNCVGLKSVIIPDGVTSIANSAFNNCTSLTSVTIPDSVTSIGSYAFYNCTSLARITIPDSVTSIGEDAFESCTSLKTVTIPNSVTHIYYSTFNYCTSLTSITIPGSVTFIDSTAFNSFSSDAVFYVEQGSYAETYAKEKGFNIVYTDISKTELDTYAKKPTIENDNEATIYSLEFLGSTNKIIRLTASALSELNLVFNDGEYNSDLLVNLVFTSGDTPPQIRYPNTGILNWIGTDCALYNGISIFRPSSNTKYDIVFSFDGSQLVGYVCGYTPATVDNKEYTTETTS